MKLTKLEKEFEKGYFCACSVMIQQHGDDGTVTDCIKENFKSVAQLKSIGVDEHDIEVLKPVIEAIEDQRK